MYFIISGTLMETLIFLFMRAFRANFQLCCAVIVLTAVFCAAMLAADFLIKKNFYSDVLEKALMMDKAYLVPEMIKKPEFYEGRIMWEVLYETGRSMNDNVRSLQRQVREFKDYIEMWIHQVKIPLSSLILIAHNHRDKFDKTTLDQLKSIEDYVEQVLYYVRGENSEKDYLIVNTPLSKAIHNVAMKNKDCILENNINFIVSDVDISVMTDSKWLEFILHQLVNNAIKYKRDTDSSCIKIQAHDYNDRTVLTVTDNGIGIPREDLPKVFDKSFTGRNGRRYSRSTGMGLFIARNLCEKLGHKIEISSKEKQYTRVEITFAKNSFYDVLKKQAI